MTQNGILQILLFCGLILLVTKPMGIYMACVFQGKKTWLSPVLRPVENTLYKLWGVDEDEEMPWGTYAGALLAFSLLGVLLTQGLLRFQGVLPLNPQGFGNAQMPPDLAFNTAISFTTNTNWQAYSPDVTLSYFSNMVALAIQNWMSAATGMAVAIALVRGFARRKAAGLGNFWVDITRATVYILLPISLVGALLMVQQGVPQNFALPVATPLEAGSGGDVVQQRILQGPIASQEVIKMLGTNGGGYFNANSAHPFENPTPFTNLLQMFLIFLIPAGLTYTFGLMVGNVRQGWALFAAMSFLFLVGAFFCYHFEAAGTPLLSGGNMEGKEVRFGVALSALFATVTTGASCGAVNSMHGSFTPLGGLVPLVNILSGEVIFGGVGAGLYGMLTFAVLAVFIAGLMVGRTPEYLGKKIEKYEVKMAMLAVLVVAASILFFTALGATTSFPSEASSPKASWNAWPGGAYGSTDTFYGPSYNNVNNNGPHGLSEILYAFTSATGNNGSAFAGLTSNTPFYNLALGLAMLIGRFLVIIPLLAMAGRLASKTQVPRSAGTLPTDTAIFAGLLVGVVVLVGALTYIPALALGPIVEHLQMLAGKLH